MIKLNLFSDYRIPIVIATLGIIIIISDFIKFNSMRKVTLKQRTKNKRGLIFRIINDSLIKFLNKSLLYRKILDKVQFNIGYFSSDSENRNRKKSEKFIIKYISINLIIFIVITLYRGLWISKIISMSVVILFEYLIIKKLIDSKREKLKDKFPILVREFIEGYALTNNVKDSFEYIVKEIHPVYQLHVNRLINQLSSTSTIDDAFNYFSNRIGYSMCSNFVSIVQSAYSTKKNIIDSLIEFQTTLDEETIANKSKKAKLRTVNNNIILWIVAIIVELYIVGVKANTSTGNFFFTTVTGQNLLFFTIGAILLAIVCIRISDSI